MTQTTERVPELRSDRIALDADAARWLHAALADLPLVTGIRIENLTEGPIEGVSLHIESDLLEAVVLPVGDLAPHEIARPTEVPVPLASERLLAIETRQPSHLTLELRTGDEVLLRRVFPLAALPPWTWPGPDALPEALAGYVRPGRPAVASRLERARAALDERGEVEEAATIEAVRRSLQDLGLTLDPEALGLASAPFDVRSPDEVQQAGRGSPLEIALFHASVLERAGLQPLVLLFEDHALVGAWLDEQGFVDPTVDEPLRLEKRLELESIVLYDPLHDAPEAAAAERLRKGAASFRYALDVGAARRAGIEPLPARDAEAADAPLPPPPPPPEPPTRVERWKRNLLDLTLRNRLLNYRATRRSVAVKVPDLALLVEHLDDGKPIQLRPESGGGDLERGRLETWLDEKDLERRLVTIYRQARSSLQEGGANTLYLATGFLVWKESPTSEKTRRAPIVLHPLVMTRRSAAEGASGYRIELADDEPLLNVTLLQKLRVDYDLRIPELEQRNGDDELDLQVVLEAFRQGVKPMPQWEVVEDVVLGLFSFTKFLMWRDLDRRGDELRENAVVRHLLDTPEEPFDQDLEIPDPETFDRERSPSETFVPLDADSTQLAAIHAAADGLTFVLEGPPGTGKSQCITNLICHALAKGKRVLFASAKMAALDVVHRRLTKVGLKPFCLELHSSKARKRGVLEQLREALSATGSRAPAGWPAEADELGQVRGGLNNVRDALHDERSFDESAWRAATLRMSYDGAPEVRLELGGVNDLEGPRVQEMRHVLHEAAPILRELGDVRDHAWRASHLEDWRPSIVSGLNELAPILEVALESVDDATGAFAGDLAVGSEGLSEKELKQLGEAGTSFRDTPAPPPERLTSPTWPAEKTRLDGWIRLGRQERERAAAVEARYGEKIVALDLEALKARLVASLTTFWPLSWFKARKAKKALKGVLRHGGLPKTQELLRDIDQAIDWRQRREEIDAAQAEAAGLLGAHWRGRATDWNALESVVEWIEQVRALYGALAPRGTEGMRERWTSLATDGRNVFDRAAPAGRRLQVLLGTMVDLDGRRREAEELLRLDPALAWGEPDDASYVARARSTASRWKARATDLRGWAAWQRCRRGIVAQGLVPLVQAVDEAQVDAETLQPAFERGLYAWWLDELFETDEALRRFRGQEEDAHVVDLQRLDRSVMSLTREAVKAHLAERLPTTLGGRRSKSDTSEMGVLQRELMKKRNMPIRRLFERTPNLLSRLKPCMLMSPLSVAQYLGPDFPPFDLVVFDEASQIPPWDAIGVIARGERLVVVGDSKQLPPTNFFQRSQEGQDLDDTDELREMESILDESIAAGLPRLHLGWHYRSKHESLIAFSNHHYYDDGLVTFPSAVHDAPHLGVKWHFVEDGVYDKGKTRTNRKEAEALVAHLIACLKDPKTADRSYGVVTFSIAQQGLIEDLLEEARRENPDLEPCFDDAREDPLFVKNLENVQGDERDVILMSVCYGPDTQGRLSLNFGPLNRDGGERRLNVAVTRSREQVLVFSTLRAEQIDLSRTQSDGARHLKAFLEYAERGPATWQGRSSTGDEAKTSAFRTRVRTSLEAAGWEVAERVGQSAYRIDLAVEDPGEEGRYLAALETDGAMYAEAATARDRHVTRPSVLRHLGWEHQRIWALDWLHDPERESQRLIESLETWKTARESEPRPKPQATPEPTPDDPAPPQEPTDLPLGLALGGRPYQAAKLRKRRADPKRFYDPDQDDSIVRAIREVVGTEAPVALETISRRLADQWGLKRLTSRLRERVQALAMQAGNWRFSATSTAFLWGRNQEPESYGDFRVPEAGARPPRRARHIPAEEIANAADALLRAHIGIAFEDLAKETGRAFGYRRITEKVQGAMVKGVELLVSRADAVLDDGVVHLPEDE